MARIAVISDVHGNRQALEAVLRAVRQAGADRLWCLGDIVGYGADPVACLALCVTEAERCLAGNHDLAVTGRVPVDVFSEWAREAIEWTQARLDRSGIAKLDRLQPADPEGPVALFHASPRDPVWEYVLTEDQARVALELNEADLVMVGHTHVPSAWQLTPDDVVDGGFVPREVDIRLTGGRWVVNPGSVGQPRNRDPRAAWALIDEEERSLSFRRTPYDVAGAQNAILSAGLPAQLAARLSEGR